MRITESQLRKTIHKLIQEQTENSESPTTSHHFLDQYMEDGSVDTLCDVVAAALYYNVGHKNVDPQFLNEWYKKMANCINELEQNLNEEEL